MKRASLLLIVLLVFSFTGKAQDTTAARKLVVHGYVKMLEGATFLDNADELYAINFLHNRVNMHWYPMKTIEVRAELRTRLFWGEQVRMDPMLAQKLNKDNGLVDLSWVIADERSLVLHTMLDRASVRWENDRWEITAGRQRINWGINTAWNPNDIFNAFNYFDFDYEERPGTDALRVQYYSGTLSSLEAAIRPGKNKDETVAGLLYRFNRKNYDVQLLAGRWKADWVAGFGWAGGIKKWGFKGEGSYFHPHQHFFDTTGTASASIAFDRTLKSDNYVSASFLYNSNGSTKALNIATLPSMELSARELMPFRFSFLVQGSHLFSPLFSGNFGVVYSPSGNSVILLPAFNYSLSNNSSADLVGQFFLSDINNTYRSAGNAVYLRVRYDF